MGFRYAKGLRKEVTQAIVRERSKRPFDPSWILHIVCPSYAAEIWCCWLRLELSIRLAAKTLRKSQLLVERAFSSPPAV